MTTSDMPVDDINALLMSLVRGEEKKGVVSRLEEIVSRVPVDGTQALCYCYCLKIDANGNLRVKDLVDFIRCRIVDYAIPRVRLAEAIEHYKKTGSASHIEQLGVEARNLFVDIGKTGEGGEVLLYILAEEILSLPQLICKMPLKTSPHVHYHGADGVHFRHSSETGILSLYWCESKMYADIDSGLTSCLESIKPFLFDPFSSTATQERDLQLISANIKDLNCPAVEDFIVNYFDKDNELSNQLEYKGICFVGFDEQTYPEPTDLTKTTEQIKNVLMGKLGGWLETLAQKIGIHQNLNVKELHIFLVPFRSVQEFRDCFLKVIK